MKYIELSNSDKKVLVDNENYEFLNQWKWHLIPSGYCSRNNRPKTLMHRLIMNTPNGVTTDHINHHKLDNRRKNLRICSNAENQQNRRIMSNNKSGFKGVYKRNNLFYFSIKTPFKRYYFPGFKDVLSAAKAYEEKAKELFGEFALLTLNKK